LGAKAANVFTGPLITLLDTIRRDKEQTVDLDNRDNVTFAGWSGDAKENASNLAKDFAAYLEEHRDQIEALSIFYSQPARRSQITYAMIRKLLEALKTDQPKLAPFRVWQAYKLLDAFQGSDPANELTALVALVRRVCGIDAKLAPYAETVRRNFQSWILKRHSGAGEKFTGEQLEWLHMIRDHIASSIHLDRDDLEMAPFNGKGGLGRMYQLFGDGMDAVIEELNEVLAA
jgi:type I restriction enzyme R subunit